MQGQVLLFYIFYSVFISSRAKVVRKAEERFWKQLSFSCMSEEDSASEDENHSRFIICHSPSFWRSSGNCLLNVYLVFIIKLQV